jgi:ribosomal protein S11
MNPKKKYINLKFMYTVYLEQNKNNLFTKSEKKKLFFDGLNTIENPFTLKYKYKRLQHYNNKIKPLIFYTINIYLSSSNINFNITDRTGNLKLYYTAGLLGFKGSQKTKKFTLISILKKILSRITFLKNKSVLLRFKGIKNNQKLIIKKLKEKVLIKAIIYHNLLPHNGCRPKKIRRK